MKTHLKNSIKVKTRTDWSTKSTFVIFATKRIKKWLRFLIILKSWNCIVISADKVFVNILKKLIKIEIRAK